MTKKLNFSTGASPPEPPTPLAELDEDDPAALSGIVELMMDPEFEAAAGSIEQYTKDECDIALGASPES